VDSAKVLQRAAEARLGGNGKFADLDIVFVDWYDWSGSRSPGCELIVQAIEGKATPRRSVKTSVTPSGFVGE
jgi:hypothetical protein